MFCSSTWAGKKYHEVTRLQAVRNAPTWWGENSMYQMQTYTGQRALSPRLFHRHGRIEFTALPTLQNSCTRPTKYLVLVPLSRRSVVCRTLTFPTYDTQQFRPATRQELIRPKNRQHAAATTTTTRTKKNAVGKPDHLEHGHQPNSFRERPQSKHGGVACDVDRPSPLPRDIKAGGDHGRQREISSSAGMALADPRNTRETKVEVEEGSGCPGAVDRLPPDSAPRSGAENAVGKQRCNSSSNYRGGGSNNQREDNDKNNNNNVSSSNSDNSTGNTRTVEHGGVSLCGSPVDTTLYHVARCICELCRRGRSKRTPGPPALPTFKFVGAEPRLVSATLQANQFRRHKEGCSSWGRRGAAWRLLWSTQHLR